MIKQAVKVLTDIPYVIAGGYARDTFFGVPPKDVDVFIQDRHRSEVLSRIVRSGCHFKDHNKWYANNTKNSNHITSVINVGNTDYIFIPEHLDIEFIAEHFDFNLNQFMLIDGVPEYVGGSDYSTLVQLHPDVPDHRCIKIFRKHQELIKNGKV
jgi:hypothetical protein